jgi:hypothetical protein
MKSFLASVAGALVGTFLARFLTDNYVLWVVLQVPWAVWALVAVFIAGLFLIITSLLALTFRLWWVRP